MEIENNIPVPIAKAVAKRARKPKGETKATSAASLITALKFISLAQKPIGTPYQAHCIMYNNWCVAFDGVLTIGCRIEENINACPKTFDLLAALQKCGEQFAITQLNEGTLSVKSGKFKATIKCVPFSDIPQSGPDTPLTIINEEIKKAFDALAWLATEGATDAFCASVMLQAQTCVATNRHVLLEYWHGLDMPPGIQLLIPRASVNAIVKSDRKLTNFGFSDNSATFFFENDAFIKTQLFKDQYPNYQAIFAQSTGNVSPLPLDFFAGVDAVSPFSENKFVYLRGDKIMSHSAEELGAMFELLGIPNDIAFNHEYLKAVEPHFKNTIFVENQRAKLDKVFFSNGMIRGALMAGGF